MSNDPYDSTDTFKIVFRYYSDYNVDVKINGYLDPFDDNSSGGEILLYAVFPSGAPELKEDSLPGERHMYIDSAGILTYEIKYSDPDDTYSTTSFMMKNKSFKAGDDFVINFKTYNAGEFTSFSSPIEDFIDFFGVIDKKFLDEANLYIDDGFYYDWNGDDQIDISSFTWHMHDSDPLSNMTINNAVAYSEGAQDSPNEFNEKLQEQLDLINYIYPFLLTTPYIKDLFEGINWDSDSTIAPRINYGSPKTPLYFRSSVLRTFLSASSEQDLPQKIDVFSAVEGKRPYFPGFSSLPFLGEASGDESISGETNVAYIDPGEPTVLQYFHAGQSAGVDCIGLVQRSASYYGNPYSLTNLGEHPWTTSDSDAATFVNARRTLYFDEDHSEYLRWYGPLLNKITDKSTYFSEDTLKKIIPGDILYYTSANGYHTGIVDRIEYSIYASRRSDLQLNGVKIIEATTSSVYQIGSVINLRTLYFYTFTLTDRDWRIGRLK